MIKITSGNLAGRVFSAPKGSLVRPTAVKIRQAVFNILKTRVSGAFCVDFFAGTGALGFEALSCGASRVIFVEKKYGAFIARNAEKLKADKEKFQIYRSDYRAAAGVMARKGLKADIIFADPPYNFGYVKKILKLNGINDILNDKGVIVLESHIKEANEAEDFMDGFNIVKKKKYGDTIILMIEKENNNG